MFLTRDYYHFLKFYLYDSLKKDTDYYSKSGLIAKRLLYIHIPKTGGVTINKYLYNSLGGGHASIQFYDDYLGTSLDKFIIFSVVRDPLERYISAINFILNGGYKGNEEFLKENLYRQGSFDINSFTCNELKDRLNLNHFKTQSSFLINEWNQIDSRVILYKFPNFFHLFNKKLDNSSQENTVDNKYYSKSDLDQNSINELKKFYALDFELYNSISLRSNLPFK